MFGEETTYPNTLRFTCDEGFILIGSSMRKCETNGSWSGNETKCQGLMIRSSSSSSSPSDSLIYFYIPLIV